MRKVKTVAIEGKDCNINVSPYGITMDDEDITKMIMKAYGVIDYSTKRGFMGNITIVIEEVITEPEISVLIDNEEED